MRLPVICVITLPSLPPSPHLLLSFSLTLPSLPSPPAICAIALPSLPPLTSCYLCNPFTLTTLPPLTSCYLCNHVDHLVQGDVATLALSQVLQETAMLHQLCDNVDGLLQCADGIQLKQVWMMNLFHHLRFCDKVFYLHRA